MLLADTSAWIEYLRGTGSPSAVRLREGLAQREIVVVDPVVLEVMSGARRDAIGSTRRLLEAQRFEPLASRLDWLDAAEIYRELRTLGVTVRSLVDVLISAVAIRLELPVLHHDRDFENIAEHTRLEVVD